MQRFQSNSRRFAIIGTLAVMGLALLLIISWGVATSAGLAAFDQPTLEWFNIHRSEWLTTITHIATTLLSAELLLVVATVIAIIWYRRSHERWRPLFFVSAFAGAVGTAWLVKVAVARYRPLPDTMLPPLETGYSLPSIHTFGIAVFLLILGYLLYSRQRNRQNLWIWLAFAALLTIIAAITRLYLGYHWLTDTVASIGLALIALSIVILIDTYWQSRRRILTQPKSLK